MISDASGTSGATVLHMTEAEHGDRGPARLRRRPRRRLSVVVRTAAPVPRRVSARTDSDRRRSTRRSRACCASSSSSDCSSSRTSMRPRPRPRTAARRNRALAREAARESIVLLKNDARVLPLAEDRRVDRRDWRGCRGSAARRLQRARQSQGVDSRRHPARARPGGDRALRAGPRPDDSRVRRRAGGATVVRAGRRSRCAASPASISTTRGSKARRG